MTKTPCGLILVAATLSGLLHAAPRPELGTGSGFYPAETLRPRIAPAYYSRIVAGESGGKRYLKAESVKQMTSVQSGDPVKNRIYLLMIQRADLGNSDGSEMRRAFQDTATQP